MPDPSPEPAPHPRRPVLRVWLAFGALSAVWVLVIAAHMPPAPSRLQQALSVARPALSLLAGFGVSLPLALLWANRSHLRAMLRFRWAKVMAAGMLAGFTPVAIWGPLPSALGFWLFFFGYAGIARADAELLLQTLVAGLGAFVLAYAVASALIWGLTRRRRIGGFALFYLGQVALVVSLGLIFSGEL